MTCDTADDPLLDLGIFFFFEQFSLSDLIATVLDDLLDDLFQFC